MAPKMIKLSKVKIGMRSWKGELVGLFKETSGGIPTGRMSLVWETPDGGDTHIEVLEKDALVEVFRGE